MNFTHGLGNPLPEDIHSRSRNAWNKKALEREKNIPKGLRLHISMKEALTEPVALSPDGRYITSGAMDATVRLWDPLTGSEVKVLPAHTKLVSSVAWSSSGLLASGARDTLICLWKPDADELLNTLTGHSRTITALAWAPSETLLASGADDKSVRIWDVQAKTSQHTLLGHHPQSVRCLAWSQDEQVLASGDDDGRIRLWNMHTRTSLNTIDTHSGGVCCLAWSPTRTTYLASGNNDATVRIWDTNTGRQIHILEGHARRVTNIAFSLDGLLLVSQSVSDGAEACFWRTDTWELLASLPINPFRSNFPLLFQANKPHYLLTGGDTIDEIRIWQVDIDLLLKGHKPTIQYSNARVVLAGDSGVGKTGLFHVLLGEAFAPTESTHARRVATLYNEEVSLNTPKADDDKGKLREQREILLWDLAGQPGYREIHQLRLSEVTLGLVVFDAHYEMDPFASIYYWDRALRQAHSVSRQAPPLLKKFLIAARIDRSSIAMSRERINELVQELGFDRYIETSASEGYNIAILRDAIKEAIDWDTVPHVTSNELFETIKDFILEKRQNGLILSRSTDLYAALLIASSEIGPDSEEQRAQFARCIMLVESRDLIMQFRFGDYVLLQPERLDAYSAALVNSVRDTLDGRGSILEARVKNCQFRIPSNERIQNKADEKLLLLAMIEDMLRHELALREHTPSGNFLVFPSLVTYEKRDMLNPGEKALLFDFAGSIRNVYATLVVRLSRSEFFMRKDLWKDGVTFTADIDGLCSILLEVIGEGRGRLELFFNAKVSKEAQFHFEDYVEKHLERWALPDSVQRSRLFTCPEPTCREPILLSTVIKRRKRNFNWLDCSNCGTRINISEDEVRPSNIASQTIEIDVAADRHRNLDILRSTRHEEVEINTGLGNQMSYYDLFLCHSRDDVTAVRQVGDQLLKMNILPWFNEWEVAPGQKWEEVLDEQSASIAAIAVFVGNESSAPWQDTTTDQQLRSLVHKHTIFLVILPGHEAPSQVPSYIKGQQINMNGSAADPFMSLIERIKTRTDQE